MCRDKKLVSEWITRTFSHEGGYSNNKDDPGGETNFGISRRQYPNLNIKELTIEEATQIYINDYLIPLKWELYPINVGYQMFDISIHSGIKTAIKLLQKAVGVKQDGVLGPITIGKIKDFSSVEVVNLLLAERINFLTGLSGWEVFGKGWMRRIAKNLRYGVEDS